MKNSLLTLRFLAGALWRYDPMIYVFFIISCLLGAIMPYVGILMPRYIMYGLLTPQAAEYWIMLFGIFGIASIGFGGIHSFASQAFKGHINAARNGCFGKLLTEKMQRIQYMQLEQPSVQELCFRANFLFWSETSGMAGVFDGLRQMLTGMLALIGMIAILFELSPWLPLLLVFLLILNVHLLTRARNNENEQRPAASKLDRELDYLSTIMHDIVAGKDIRLYGMTGYFIQSFRRVSAVRRVLRHGIRARYRRAELSGICLAFIREALLYAYLIIKIADGQLTPDRFILFISAASGFTLTFGSIIESFLNIRQFIGQAKDFQSVLSLEEEPACDSLPNGAEFSHSVIQNVRFAYPNGFSLYVKYLTIHRGEHIAIVGPNGSGKTTFVKLLLGLYRPQEGAISTFFADGTCVKGTVFGMFSTVMQKIYQYAMTIDENIAFHEYADINTSQLHRAIDGSQFTPDIAAMPNGGRTMLRKDFDPAGINLSGGMQQKLALSRALYRNAPIMVLDEPSASLDPVAEQRLFEAFDQLFHDKTCIYVSHRLSSVRFCNRVLVMDEGQIVAMGTHEELMNTCPLYARMYDAQSQPYREIAKEACDA